MLAVLDIDLDYFLDSIPHIEHLINGRLPSEDYKVWNKAEFESFILNRCKLTNQNKVRGRIVRHHHEAFFYWRELILKNIIEYPFKIIHIDSHIDLSYIGDGSWNYIQEKYLCNNYSEMIYPERIVNNNAKFGCANYLLYALACGWIEEMDYIIHPELEELDAPLFLCKKIQDNKFGLYLKKSDGGNKKELIINTINKDDFFITDKIDCVTVAISPQYTPIESDKLVSVISEYLILE